MKQARKLASHIYIFINQKQKGNMLSFVKNTGRHLAREKTKSITSVS